MLPDNKETKIIQFAVFGIILVASFILIIVLAIDKDDSADKSSTNSDESIEAVDIDEAYDREEDSSIKEVSNPRYPDYKSGIISETEGDIVLFFHAKWCPTCISLNEAIEDELDEIPDDVTIIKVDYDSEETLVNKYNVLYQHTLIQVNKEGNELKKWFGSPDLESILSEIE